MWIQVRTMDGKETHRVDSLSKLTKVDELRLKIMELFKVEPERQRLFYRGKQVRRHDYNFVLMHIFQVIHSGNFFEKLSDLNSLGQGICILKRQPFNIVTRGHFVFCNCF